MSMKNSYDEWLSKKLLIEKAHIGNIDDLRIDVYTDTDRLSPHFYVTKKDSFEARIRISDLKVLNYKSQINNSEISPEEYETLYKWINEKSRFESKMTNFDLIEFMWGAFHDTKLDTSYEAYWINPNGKIHGVKSTHINSIIENPYYFSFTKGKIDQIYVKYKEPMGLEGKARNEIIKKVLNKGWIRIQKNKNFYTAQMMSLNNTCKDYLQQFTQLMIDAGVHKYSEIKIMTSSTVITKSFEEISLEVPVKEKHFVDFIEMFSL